MGFTVTDKEGHARPAAFARGSTAGADCINCPFSRLGRPVDFVTGEGPQNPEWIIVGEGPGRNEVVQQRPFVGTSGQLINEVLVKINVKRENIWITNATLCAPVLSQTANEQGIEETKRAARRACAPRLQQELAAFPGVPVLALGSHAAQGLTGDERLSITQMAGSCYEVDVDGTGRRSVIPSIHPAAILRGGSGGGHGGGGGGHTVDLAFWNLLYDASKVNLLSRGADIRFTDDIQIEISDAARAKALVSAFVADARKIGKFACDTETYVDDPKSQTALSAITAKLSAIGLATSERAISIAWDICFPDVLAPLDDLFADPAVTKVFHNSLYDIPVLEKHGFVIAGAISDTMLMHHNAFPGLSHNLQRVTTQFYAAPPWKCLRGDVEVMLPDRSTMSIADAVRQRVPEILSYENNRAVSKRVTGWHKVHVPGQAWIAIQTERSDRKYTRGLVVTPDHKIMTSRGLVEAQEIRPGVDRIAIDEPTFSSDQVATALGTLLGDSSLHVSRAFHATPWEAPRASVRGGHTNEGLRDMKVAALALGTRCATHPAHERVTRTGATIRAATFYRYGTTWAFQYKQLAALIYDAAWKRRIKPTALAQLGQRGLAMMYMDDGDLARRGRNGETLRAGFATHGFPIEDVELFATWLEERYGAVAIYASSRGPYTALSAAATRNMLEDLRGFIHPAVGYKTIYTDPFKPVVAGIGVYHAQVTAVNAVTRPTTMSARQRHLFDHRYCLSVADTKLFFTNYGLVSNSEYRHGKGSLTDLLAYNARDTLATARIEGPIHAVIKRSKAEQTYEVDLAMAHAARTMHVRGVPIDRATNESLRSGFQTNIDAARDALLAIVEKPDIRELFEEHLAFERARKQRKNDPEKFNDRLAKRLAEIRKGTTKFMLDSGDHVAAFLKASNVPLSVQTTSGRISTRKDVLEEYVAYPEVRALLTYRENAKLLSTYVERMFTRKYADGTIKYGFVDDNDRVHPRWSIHKITGRWGSEAPVCFDGETEILTPTGWVRFDQLTSGSQVAQFCAQTNAITFVTPTQQFSKPHDGEMVHITGRYTDLCVTPDHRLLIERRSGRREDVLARDYTPHGERNLLHAGQFAFGTTTWTSDEITLLCAAQADGWWQTSGWAFGLIKPRKIERLTDALNRLGLSFTLTEKTDPNPFKPGEARTQTRIYVHQCALGDRIRELLGADKVYGHWLLDFTRAAINQFIDELVFWDGNFTRGGEFFSSDRRNADWIQAVLTLANKRSMIYAYRGSPLQTRPNWQVRFRSRTRSATTATVVTRLPWNAPVYCVTVPTGYVVVRRTGRVVIAGNCQNVPKADKKKGRPNLRSQVIAPEGRAFVAFDAKQLEARLIALMSGDAFLLDIFRKDKDIHSEFARLVWPDFDTVPVDERKVRRDIIKRPEYSSFYGGSVETSWKAVVRDYPNVTLPMIQRMVTLMQTKMRGVMNWHQNMLRVADRDGEIRSMFLGRRRAFPIKQFDLSEVVNFPIQSSSADLINMGLRDIMPRLPATAFPILQIHDAVVFECDEDDQDLVKKLVVESFTREESYNGNTMLFPVDARAGKSWADVN